jgi:putative endonuclease
MSEIISLNFKDKHLPAAKTSFVGKTGEDLAAQFLTRNGYKLILSNFKAPIGRNNSGVQISGEIDVIALDGDCLCFVEVKTRSSDDFASPLAAVDLRKQRQIIRTARVYRKIFNLKKVRFRYDVVSIVLNGKKAPNIELFKSFWTEDKFRKKGWSDDFYN